MSHGKLREEKNCLNCGHIVEEKFCPNCGQENTETRRPFHYLFTHFIEDLTHYDGQFWGTIKNLLFKPGKLTQTYLEGKRQRYVPPVKLYIFISFITFFLFSIFPPFNIDFNEGASSKELKQTKVFSDASAAVLQQKIDSLKSLPNMSHEDSVALQKVSAAMVDSAAMGNLAETFDMDKSLDADMKFLGYTHKKAYDSARVKNPGMFDFIKKPVAHKFFELKEKGAKKGDILKNFALTSFHNLPKALFIYLPLFAFFLWIFHNKKRWWYFDHGVFTLHYFAFLLLNILLLYLLYKLSTMISSSFVNFLIYLLITALFIYNVVYFFLAHQRVYKTKGFRSFILGTALFMVNFFAFLFLLLGLGVISFLMIH